MALVVVTHDRELAARARRQIRMRDGLIESTWTHGRAGSGVSTAEGSHRGGQSEERAQ